ncbi:hypothetical protein PDR5_20920 [Pseudomonas sp. DR 5-09]|nr:hypothetical protein PDR5_20920 [Pseudomonas sp. DR 5-09]
MLSCSLREVLQPLCQFLKTFVNYFYLFDFKEFYFKNEHS